jgi:cytochrome c1
VNTSCLRSRIPAIVAVLAACAACTGCGGSDDGAAAGAPAAYEDYACAGCHSLDGSRKSGPTFKGLAGSTVTLTDGRQVTATAAYLRRAIVDPDAETVEGYVPGVMTAGVQAFDLASKPDEVQELVDFIETLK